MALLVGDHMYLVRVVTHRPVLCLPSVSPHDPLVLISHYQFLVRRTTTRGMANAHRSHWSGITNSYGYGPPEFLSRFALGYNLMLTSQHPLHSMRTPCPMGSGVVLWVGSGSV